MQVADATSETLEPFESYCREARARSPWACGSNGAAVRKRVRLQRDRIVAVGLLTERDLRVLGPSFEYAWPEEDAPDFAELLRAIDDADSRPAIGSRREPDTQAE